MARDLHIITGAFGYSGKYMARRLLAAGKQVKTLTGHSDRPNPFEGKVEALPFDFDEPERLVGNLRGVACLYNTYWIRFERGAMTYDRAVGNTKTLIRSAAEAGVRRFVHVSITQPSEDSPFPYFRGKAEVERALKDSGLSYAVLRPTVLFGVEDILINNIAWLLRHLPVFGIIGRGDYTLQPVYVDDLAALAVEQGERTDNVVMDAVGPDVYTFDELVRLTARAVHSHALIIRVPPAVALAAARLLSVLLRDVVLTRDEVGGLMANLLVSDGPPTCPTRFSDWLRKHANELGKRYHSELARHFR